jgi:hypothetical protein
MHHTSVFNRLILKSKIGQSVVNYSRYPSYWFSIEPSVHMNMQLHKLSFVFVMCKRKWILQIALSVYSLIILHSEMNLHYTGCYPDTPLWSKEEYYLNKRFDRDLEVCALLNKTGRDNTNTTCPMKSISLWLYSPCGPWPLFLILNPIHSR